jgi:1,4-alpha-glucan branching enzyme
MMSIVGHASEASCNRNHAIHARQIKHRTRPFRPYNETVELIGSWNDFKADADGAPEDGWWRQQVPLEDGEYRYKFRVKSNSYFCRGEMKDVFDPYGISVTDDALEASFMKIENGRQNEYSYEWKHDDVPLPTNDKLVIYEMHVGDFTRGLGRQARAAPVGERRTSAMCSTSSITWLDLGINCVELMP